MKAKGRNPFNLSPREIEVLNEISIGNTEIEIAKHLCLSIHTIHTHRKKLLCKTAAKNTADLIRIGFETGLLKFQEQAA